MAVDPAFAAMLRDPRLAIRPPPAHVPVARFREAANGFMATTDTGLAMHAVDDLPVPADEGANTIRLYRPSPDRLPVIVFVHGGGFVLGDLETHDALCRRLAAESRCAVAAVDYRTAPEHPFPVPLDDVRGAVSWIAEHAGDLGLRRDRVALCGDSAGGYLAAKVAMATARAGSPVRHLALLYPVVDPACASRSMQEFATGYMLTQAAMQWFWQCYVGSAVEIDDPRFLLTDGDASNWPATSITTAEYDPLRDEGEQLADWLRQRGTPTVTRRYAGMIHGFAQFTAMTAVAQAAIVDIARDLAKALDA